MTGGEVALGDELCVGFEDGIAGKGEIPGEHSRRGEALASPEASAEDAFTDGFGQALVGGAGRIVGEFDDDVQE